MPIDFFNEEGAEYPFEGKEDLYTDWLSAIASAEGMDIVQLNYIFCTDEYLLTINQTYLNHDDYTDIITFPYQEGEKAEADIYISLERVTENAVTFGCDVMDELRRVMAHGLLHLSGHKDKSEEESNNMREAEDKSVALFHQLTRQ